MTEGFRIDPLAVYDDAALVIGLGVGRATLTRARKSGQLRSTRKGRRILYRGAWVLEWLNQNAAADQRTFSKDSDS